MNYNQFSPQYYQQQFDSQLQQYSNLYNQNRNVNAGFIGQYVNSYEEVEKGQVNMNGIPTMYVSNGVFWIKKFVNGQSYITAYKFESMNNVGEPQQQEPTTENNTIIEAISKSLEQINARLEALEGVNK